jgi:hypothetical protein
MEILNKATMEEMISTPNRLLLGAEPGNLDLRVARALTLRLLSHLAPPSGRAWTQRQTCSARCSDGERGYSPSPGNGNGRDGDHVR